MEGELGSDALPAERIRRNGFAPELLALQSIALGFVRANSTLKRRARSA